jgi:hypothetical protein
MINERNNTMNDLTNTQKELLIVCLEGPDARLKANISPSLWPMYRILCPQYLSEYGDHFQFTAAGKKVAEEWKEQIESKIPHDVEAKKKKNHVAIGVNYRQMCIFYQDAELIQFELDRIRWKTIGDQKLLLEIRKWAENIQGSCKYYVMTGRLECWCDMHTIYLHNSWLNILSERLDDITQAIFQTRGDGECDEVSIHNIGKIASDMKRVRDGVTLVVIQDA